jgi:hypothetical protein
MKKAIVIGLGILALGSTVPAMAHDYRHFDRRVDARLDRRGDRINNRLDNRGSRINERLGWLIRFVPSSGRGHEAKYFAHAFAGCLELHGAAEGISITSERFMDLR